MAALPNSLVSFGRPEVAQGWTKLATRSASRLHRSIDPHKWSPCEAKFAISSHSATGQQGQGGKGRCNSILGCSYQQLGSY
jgi:hypothetical protein